MNPDDNLMEAATALAELRKTHLEALGAATSRPPVTASCYQQNQQAGVSQIVPNSAPYTLSSTKGKFPMRMHAVLSDPQVADVITWLPCGRSFVILRPDLLASRVLPLYFSQESRGVRYSSFTRKLNRWGFRQISSGPNSGAFYHELFTRDDVEACKGMVCAKSRKRDAKSVSSGSTVSGISLTKPAVASAAVTVSTSGVSRSLPLKKRKAGFGIPNNVEMKPNNTSLLEKRTSVNSIESSLSDSDDKLSTVSKDSTVGEDKKCNSAFTLQTAKETLARHFERAKESSVIPLVETKSNPTFIVQQDSMSSAKEALARNFHEQYRAFALASLRENSLLAMAAKGMDVEPSSEIPSISSTQGPDVQALEADKIATATVAPTVPEPIATQAQQSEAANAAKSALYEAYMNALSS